MSQYDKVLHNLLEDSPKSRTGHPRDHESLLDPEQTVREVGLSFLWTQDGQVSKLTFIFERGP